MIVRSSLLGLLAVAAVPGRAAPADTAVANARWAIDYGTKYCSLSRQSLDNKTPDITLRLIPGTASPEMLVLGDGWNAKLPMGLFPVNVVLGPDHENTWVTASRISVIGSDVRGFGINGLPEWFVTQLGRAGTLAIEQGKTVLVKVDLAKVGKAVAALRECNDKLLAAWGIDTAETAALKAVALPLTPVPTWFPPDEFPAKAARDGRSGTVVARYTVGETGLVSDCEPVGSSGVPALDAQTCHSILAHGRYEPAIGPKGKAVSSKVIITVNWVGRKPS